MSIYSCFPPSPEGLVYRDRTVKTETYRTTGCFSPDSPDSTLSNLRWCGTLSLDCDAASWLISINPEKFENVEDPEGAVKRMLHGLDHDKLDVVLEKHLAAVRGALDDLHVSYTVIVRSGYGHHVHCWLDETDGRDLDTLRNLLPRLAKYVNEHAGYGLVDENATDAGTRILREIGTKNRKNPLSPREVRTVFVSDPVVRTRLGDIASLVPDEVVEVEELPDADGWIVSNTGAVKNCLANAIVALGKGTTARTLRYDTRRHRVVEGDGEKALSDEALTEWRAACVREHDFEPSSGTALEAHRAVARRTSYDPLADHLSGLTWDGVERLSGWLSTGCGAVDRPLTRAYARRWLISAVARAMSPGCKADHVLVLVGPQGARKSTALRVLAGDGWFSDSPLRIGEKDGVLGIYSAWIVEIAEFEGVAKSSAGAAKAFLAGQEDIIRVPYGRLTETWKRHCVFGATTNDRAFLGDPTGSRRYWPVECGFVDIGWLTSNRDQLLAEALAAYKAGETWWLSAAEEVLRTEEAALWSTPDVLEEAVLGWLGSLPARDFYFSEAMNAVHESVPRAAPRAVAEALRRVGCEPVRSARVRSWHVPEAVVARIREDEHIALEAYKAGKAVPAPTTNRAQFQNLDSLMDDLLA